MFILKAFLESSEPRCDRHSHDVKYNHTITLFKKGTKKYSKNNTSIAGNVDKRKIKLK